MLLDAVEGCHVTARYRQAPPSLALASRAPAIRCRSPRSPGDLRADDGPLRRAGRDPRQSHPRAKEILAAALIRNLARDGDTQATHDGGRSAQDHLPREPHEGRITATADVGTTALSVSATASQRHGHLLLAGELDARPTTDAILEASRKHPRRH